MSAWMLSTKHTDALVEGAVRLGLIERSEATKTGRMLVRANVRSMGARYGETRESLGVTTYFYNAPRKPLTDAELLKSAHCYDYQTCEYDAYPNSPARRLIVRIESALPGISYDSPEYKAAPWGI